MSTVRRRSVAALRSSWVWGALIALVSWPVASIVPQAGIDPSWHAGLYLAADRGLDFGPDVLWTYGPLGFLKFPELYYTWPTRLAGLYTGALQIALCTTLVWSARRWLPVWAAVLVAYVAASLIFLDAVVPLAFLLCAAVLLSELRWRTSLAVAGGVFAGFEILAKLSTGIQILVLVALTLLLARDTGWRDRRRVIDFAAFTASVVVTIAALWLVAGQPIGNLAAFLRDAGDIVSGYSSAMSTSPPSENWELGAAAAVAALMLYGAFHSTRGAGERTRWSLVAIVVAFLYMTFKSGFVRHDNHALIYFGSAAGGFLAFTWPRESRPVAIVGLSLLAVSVLGALAGTLSQTFAPVARTKRAVTQLRDTVEPGRRGRAVQQGRSALFAAYPLDARTQALLRGRTVHVDPSETAIAWAYRLRWRPLPIFQTYSAYTPRLDGLNADRLASGDAPQRILRQPIPPADGRFAGWDPPRATVEMLCRYLPMHASAGFLVLRRVPSRCGRQRSLATVRAAFGQAVPVPPASPTSAVLLRLRGAGVSGLERIKTLLYKSAERTAVIDGARSYRLLPATARDGLLMSLPTGADYPPPFGFSPQARSIGVRKGSGGQPSGRHLSYEFVSMPIAVTRPVERSTRGKESRR